MECWRWKSESQRQKCLLERRLLPWREYRCPQTTRCSAARRCPCCSQGPALPRLGGSALVCPHESTAPGAASSRVRAREFGSGGTERSDWGTRAALGCSYISRCPVTQESEGWSGWVCTRLAPAFAAPEAPVFLALEPASALAADPVPTPVPRRAIPLAMPPGLAALPPLSL